MTEERVKRKLTAIFSADVQGYSRLMGEYELGTIETLKEYRKIMARLIKKYQGRVVDSTGDNLLAEFTSVVNAVESAVEIQKELKVKNADLPENRRMEFRIGINLGDVVEEGDRIYGDGVNIAARIEKLAEGGGVCISGSTFEQVENKLPMIYEDMGNYKVKNVTKPIHVYRILVDHPDAIPEMIGDPSSEAEPSIAVLPFLNMSGDVQQEYFSDGITEEIITSLSKTPRLLVIARNSTFAYKGEMTDIQRIGRELGVNYILKGSVQKADKRVRIIAQLINADSGEHLWAERYDRELKDIFSLQDEITLRIIQALQVKLTEGEQARIYGRGTDNLDAYLKWLQGQEYLIRGNRDDNLLARRIFEEAIRLDPDWGQAYVLLGWTHLLDSTFGWSSSPKSSLTEAINLAHKSLALDNSLPGPHGLMSQIYLHERQHDKAIAAAKKAVALEPNLAFAYTWLGSALMYAGRPHEAIRSYEKAMRRNPFPPGYYIRDLGEVYRMAGRYREAITKFKRAIRGNPDYLEAHLGLACTYASLDRGDDAKTAAAEVLRIDPEFSLQEYEKSLPYKEQRDLNSFIEAMGKAGLPD